MCDIGQFRIREICESCGISQGALYKYLHERAGGVIEFEVRREALASANRAAAAVCLVEGGALSDADYERLLG